jgi:hypothetical protein
MSLTKLSLGGNNLYMTSLFPARESLLSDIPHSKKFPQRMLSSWVLHRRHIHRDNTSTVNDKMYCLWDWQCVLGFCPITLLTMHYSVTEGKGPRFESSMWKKIMFFLDIKKILYPMKRMSIMMLKSIFLRKCINRKKIKLVVGLNSCSHPYQSCSDPLHHFVTCRKILQYLFPYGTSNGC